MKISNILESTVKVIALVQTVIIIVEDQAAGVTGPEKKAQAIAQLKTFVAQLDIPDWAKALFSMDSIIGMVIDMVVSGLNKTGFFKTGNA